MWAEPKRASTDRVLMCIHGGGFVSGSIYTHRRMFGHLAKATGARVLLVSYHLLPEGVFPVPADDVTNAYRWLLDQGISAGRVAFAGDSVGGDRGDPHPVAAPSRCSHPAHVSVPAAARNGTSVGLSGRPGPGGVQALLPDGFPLALLWAASFGVFRPPGQQGERRKKLVAAAGRAIRAR